MASDIRPPADKKGQPREKVFLKPGFHLTDWMRLNQASQDMSGLKGGPKRQVTKSELAEHTSQFDCWTAYNGTVYNITQYLQYHPGGVKKLMLGAGKDCTALFDKYHRWVNAESFLSKCVVGTLVEDNLGTFKEEEENDDDGIAAAAAPANVATANAKVEEAQAVDKAALAKAELDTDSS